MKKNKIRKVIKKLLLQEIDRKVDNEMDAVRKLRVIGTTWEERSDSKKEREWGEKLSNITLQAMKNNMDKKSLAKVAKVATSALKDTQNMSLFPARTFLIDYLQREGD